MTARAQSAAWQQSFAFDESHAEPYVVCFRMAIEQCSQFIRDS